MARSPLYDLYDPYGELSQYAMPEYDPETGTFRKPRPALADLLPEEEKRTMLRKLSEAGSSGLAGLGWFLDTPGAVVRGTLSGGPLKGASALWDTSEDRVTGRELARQYGLMGDTDTWGNFFGGIGAEVLLDPLTYGTLGLSQLVSRGAPTAAARILKSAGGLNNVDELARLSRVADATAAGVTNAQQIEKGLPRQFARNKTVSDVLGMLDDKRLLPDYADDTMHNAFTQRGKVEQQFRNIAKLEGRNADELLNSPLAKMNSFGLPFQEKDAFDLFGKDVGDYVARLGDTAAENIRTVPYLGTAVRTGSKLFNSQVLDFSTARGQDQAKQLYGIQDAMLGENKERLARFMYDAHQELLGSKLNPNSQEYARYFRNLAENKPEFNDFLPADHPLHAAFAEGTANARLINEWKAIREDAVKRANELGIKLPVYKSKVGTELLPRQQVKFDVAEVPSWPEGSPVPNPYEKNSWSRGLQRAPTRDTASLSRADYMDTTGATDIVNQMSLDKAVEGVADPMAPTHRLVLSTGKTVNAITEADGSINIIGSGGELFPVDPKLVKSSEPLAPSLVGARKALPDILRGTADEGVQDVIRKWVGETNPLTGERVRYSTLDDDIYNWVDAVDEETGKFLHPVPALKPDHPLMQQKAALTEQFKSAPSGWAGEAVREQAGKQLIAIREQIAAAERASYKDSMYVELADLMRQADPQHAKTGVPLFGNNPWNEIQDYVVKRTGTEGSGQFLLDLLQRYEIPKAPQFVPGGQVYGFDDAMRELKFDPETVKKAYATLTGRMDVDEAGNAIVGDLSGLSFPTSLVDDWASHIKRGSTTPGFDDLLKPIDDFTASFKTNALLWPARYVRDLYSGAFAAMAKGRFSLDSWNTGRKIRSGDYERLGEVLADAPGYEHLADPQARIKKFLIQAHGAGMSTSTATDELARGAGGALINEPYPGAARPEIGSLLRKVYNPDRSWTKAWLGEGFGKDSLNPFRGDFSPLATRGSQGNRNPLFDLGDRAAETTDAMNRYGTYLESVLRGDTAKSAANMANLTQVNYKPNAFTAFERDVLKRLVPFYSYTKGITPFIADEVLNNPAGLTGASVRLVNKASEPNENFFTPEYLRQSASIPLPSGFPGIGLPENSPLQRFVTNIDLPYESAVNLITPGVGNTLYDKVASGLQKTASNVLGQTNPLLKGPLEMIANRQFYSGRQLSDLYSMLEQTMGAPGRPLEQVLLNSPGGSRVLGVARQLSDNRLSPSEKALKFAVNTLMGVKFQDVDQERTKQLAARNTLNELLSATPGVRTYENITVPEEVLPEMPADQRRMYLLYKVIQAEASKKARLKAKAEEALDPAKILGIRGF